MNVDFIKIRVDDNLGATRKMRPNVYQAVIEAAHARNLMLTAHLYYLEDAKGLLEAGADFLAHSVRDTAVDDELIGMFTESGVCYWPDADARGLDLRLRGAAGLVRRTPSSPTKPTPA